MRVATVSLLLHLATPTLSATLGSIQVAGYGEVWVVAPDWAVEHIQILDNGFTMNGNGAVYFANAAYDDWDKDMYWQVPLVNKWFSYTVDLSQVGCHCNGAAYFIDMPGPVPGYLDNFYCDANMGGGSWCPEYDIMEANKYTMACTMHTCTGEDGVWDSCDRGGCQVNAYNMDREMMCPDEKCTINTNKPFTVSYYQNSTEAYTRMEQEGRITGFDMCHQPVLANMAPTFEGMVFTASLWGGGGIDMGWLDGMTGCQGQCDIDGAVLTFTGFGLTDN